MFHTLARMAKKRKGAVVLIILLIAGGSYYGYKRARGGPGETHYVLGTVEKGTLITSVSGSGQVAVSNQFEIKPKVSGDVIYVAVASGQEVKAGALILQLDSRDAQKALRDAQANLDAARIALAKLKKPADALALLQSENALAKAQETKRQAEEDLKKAYDDGFNLTANAFLDLPTVMIGLHDILFTSTIGLNQDNIDYYTDSAKRYDGKIVQYRAVAAQMYQDARAAYDKNFEDYKAMSRSSDPAVIVALIQETYATTKVMADAVKSANNLIQLYADTLTRQNIKPLAIAATHLATLNLYSGKTNTHLLNLLGIKHTIDTDTQTIAESGRTIADKTEALAKLKAGADVLDLQSQELAVRQRQNALLDAQEKLADYFIRAPFDGKVAKMDFKKGDPVSPSMAAVTIITKQRTAEITLNEVDITKVKAGAKATLSFDAVPDLSISGEVAQIDTLGTIAQGVVSYMVKLSLDTQDERVKPGMSVNASVITEVKQNVLIVPISAVKSRGNMQYVEQLDQVTAGTPADQSVTSAIAPRQVAVTTGLSNDAAVEILSGLQEGEQIIARTIVPAATTPTTATPSIFGSGARIGGGGGSGGARIMAH